jgi:hypothetical protein
MLSTTVKSISVFGSVGMVRMPDRTLNGRTCRGGGQEKSCSIASKEDNTITLRAEQMVCWHRYVYREASEVFTRAHGGNLVRAGIHTPRAHIVSNRTYGVLWCGVVRYLFMLTPGYCDKRFLVLVQASVVRRWRD